MINKTAKLFATGVMFAFLIYGNQGAIADIRKANSESPQQRLLSPTPEQMKKVSELSARSLSSESDAKLDAGLKVLAAQSTTTRGEQPPRTVVQAQNELMKAYGIKGGKNVFVEVCISGKVDSEELKNLGVNVHFTQEDSTYATVPINVLLKVANLPGVKMVKGLFAPKIPIPPVVQTNTSNQEPLPGRGGLSDSFSRQGLTGKGVVVGVVDTGIDWRHPDFIKDGNSRILYLWDMSDNTFEESGGTVGLRAPYSNYDGTSLGTVYTRDQINAGLKGRLAIGSYDTFGHGTACAGVAAGNGNATANGVPAGTYTGVAPEADLIIVDADAGGGSVRGDAHLGVRWIVDKSKEMNKPCSINLSWGSQVGAHNGTNGNELFLNEISGKGKSGVAVCVAGGNERSDSFHASGRFGPRKEGSNEYSAEIELNVFRAGWLEACFNPDDDWGLTIYGDNQKYAGETVRRFLVDDAGNAIGLFVWNNGTEQPDCLALVNNTEYDGTLFPGEPLTIADYRPHVGFSRQDGLMLWLPRGRYFLHAWGKSEAVADGRFDLYAPGFASFGIGSEHQYMVGSPGNASNVITVGAYDYRSSWPNINGSNTFYNVAEGELSDYSNPGYSRSGVVKPDIVAPATYAISSLARDEDSNLMMMGGRDSNMITKDGYHIAWRGTSAAAPYVTGTIALMLQKNPKLDSEEIRKLLADNATKDDKTGGTPNRDWGYGKLNPEQAIIATPSSRGSAN